MSDVKVSLSVELPGGSMRAGECVPALQSLDINARAYGYMTSTEPPGRFNADKWRKLTRKDRLVYHLNLIASTLGGKVRDFVVFGD